MILLSGGHYIILRFLNLKTYFFFQGHFPVIGEGNENRCSQQSQHCDDPSEFQCGQGFVDAPICIPYNLTCDGVAHCLGTTLT